MLGAKPSMASALILLVMIAIGITALMWEILAFARKRTILSTTQFVWRIISWVLIVAVLFGMFAGLFLINFPEPRSATRFWSFLIAFALFVVVFLVVMAFRDWRWIMSEQFRRKVNLYHQLGEELKRMAEEKKQVEGDEGEQK
ncbi:MAG: hypothetical protein ACUVTP_08975 [Candidatus Fervidibacter sp.]|uniref:hypothetical protein n=1 Tax=Candidatus Fervidibacter sp. TaxID=3100871 RepID=UPI00404B9A5D